jgi:hypothetical protein
LIANATEINQIKAAAGDNNLTGKLPWLVLLGIGILNLGRGGFHWLAPDSGARSVAGMNLDYPNRADVTFLLASAGLSQVFFGIWYIFMATRKRSLVPVALGLEAAKNALLLVSEYTFKHPASPVPGRVAHWAVLILSTLALVVNLRSRPARSSQAISESKA